MKTINISTLKAKASSTFREVRKGASFIVVSHDIPIAEIIPYKDADIIIKNPTRKFKMSKSSLKITNDPVKYLLEDRDSR
ncbi:MAG TPA: type II toxin-antitoxin system Phd/YefM family antitoxin [Spirochaetota bacterium]|nr:type II toxin-antitoxin system Phd/YefM family antitoxin [Spirochaetota bacterium]HPI87992.1 type II toxin-antitoxin system Phd/YefM family antitoxin [Spirochaetota bacterium]